MTSSQAGPSSSESNYIAIRRKEIAELRKKADLYGRELSSGTLNRLLHAKRREDLDKVLNEIKKLEVAIENHKFFTKEE